MNVKPVGLYTHANNGFSIVELVVVIAIMATLLSIGTISFNDWMIKNRVESQVNQMVTDFNELRMRAMTRKQRHSITINANNYVFRSYSSADEDVFAGGTVLSGGTKTVQFPLKSNATTSFAGTVLVITERGLLESTTATVYLDTNSSAAIDCLVAHTARTNPGKKNAAWSSCDDK